jgi:type IV pilus assembly protein PilB
VPLGRIQTKIIRELVELKILPPSTADAIINSESDLSGDAIEKLLLEDHKVSEETLLIARARAFDLHPFNARNFVIDEFTFELLDKDFCYEHKVLPIGVVGAFFVVALNSPFKLQLTNLISQKVRMRVLVLLALESVLDQKLAEPEQNPASIGFSDVVERLGLEFNVDDSALDDDDGVSEESAPIIQLANRIIEDAYYSGGATSTSNPLNLRPVYVCG